ncbi:MAG: hypothetical protein LBH68_09005, partial [Bifidobacteriaceae bacterium]|nr:hypothetical protein [Bifidobacteriaceae bacterium]
MHQVRLERAQIPDIVFQVGLTRGGATNLNFASATGFSFTKDGFDFTVQVVPGSGGRWYDGDLYSSGIYIGSKVRITATPTGNSLLKGITFTDRSGAVHNSISESQLRLTPYGYYEGEMILGTVNTSAYGIVDIGPEYWAYGAADRDLNFNLQVSEYTVIDLGVTNVKGLPDHEGVTIRQDPNQPSAIVFYGREPFLDTVPEGWDRSRDYFRFGALRFDKIVLDPQAYGPGVIFTTTIPGYPRITERTEILFAECHRVVGTIVIEAWDFNREFFDPTFRVASRTVERYDPYSATWERRFAIPPLASLLMFERLHEKIGPATANALTLEFAIGNTKPNPASVVSQNFLVDVYRVDSEGGNDVRLFSFVHDTSKEQSASAAGPVAVLNVNNHFYQGESLPNGWPRVALKEANVGGVVYKVYTPSYYDYTDLEHQTPTTFQGEQRIELRVHHPDAVDGLLTIGSGVRTVVDDVIKVMRPVPDDKLVRGGEGFETTRYDAQQGMYLYTDNNAAVDLPSLDFDFSTITDTLDLSASGGPGVSVDGNQITISMSLAGTPIEHKSGPNKDKSPISQMKDYGQGSRSSGSIWDPAKSSSKDSKRGGSFGGGISVTLIYDDYQGRYVFGECMFVVSGQASFTQQYPLIPAVPVAYANLSGGGGLQIASGFREVPVGVVNGRIQRRILFNGISLTPSAYFTAGLGVGIVDVVSAGLSARIEGQFEATLARSELVKGTDTLDLADGSSQVTASGTHRFLTGQNGAYQKTLMELGAPNGAATITLEAKSFTLQGIARPNGATMLVKVYHRDALLDQQSVDTYNPQPQAHSILYRYSGSQVLPLRVEISLDPAAGDQTDKVLQLDEITYKIMEELYTTTTVPGTFGDWSVKMGIQMNLRALIFSFDLDLIYFYLNQDGYGYGYPGGEKELGTWGARSLAPDPHAGVSKLDRDAGGGETMAMATLGGGFAASPQSAGDYFDLGDYAQNKSLDELDSTLFPTARSQILQVGAETYYFWIDDPGVAVRPDANHRLILQYRTKSDPTIRYVDNDGTGDFDFVAEVDATGRLQIAWTSFKAGVTVPADLSGADEFAFFLRQIELKTAVMGSDGTFGPATVVGGTADARGDSMPRLASNGAGASLLVFVKDEAGSYAADVKATGDLIDPDAQTAIEDWNNALNQGISRPYVALDQGSGFGAATAVGLGLDESFWKVGTRITSLSAGFIDASHVALAFTAEIPNAQQGAHRGVDKLLFVQYGELSGGRVVFGEAQLVQSAFDYDAPLVDVFGEAAVPDQYRGPTGFYEQPILTQAEFKQVAVPEGSGGQAAATELTLFYKLNEQLLFIPEASLKAIGGLTSGAKDIKTIDVMAAEYELNVTSDGRLYLIYSEAAESGYDAQLVFKLFNNGVWSDPVLLTHSRAFDQAAFDASQPTGAASFARFTSTVDAEDNLELLAQTAYRPFNFSETIQGPEGNQETIPYLDDSDPQAARELVLITFGQPVEALTGTAIEVDTDIFSAGDEVDISFTVTNAGDAMVSDLAVELYAGTDLIDSTSYSGAFVPGASYDMAFTYSVPQVVPHGTQLNYRLLAGAALLYESTAEQNYTIRSDKMELLFDQYEVEVNESNEVVYAANVANIGHRNPFQPVEVVFEAMVKDQSDLMVVDTTVGAAGVIHTSGPISLVSPSAYNTAGRFAIPPELANGQFNVRARIVSLDPEYSVENNVSVNSLLYPAAIITTGFEAQGNILDVKVGDEIVLDQLAVTSSLDTASLDSLTILEVLEGRPDSTLAFDTANGDRVIRVLRAPASKGTVPVKVQFNIDGSTVSQWLILNVSAGDPLNLTGDSAADGVDYGSTGWPRQTVTPPSPYLEDDFVVAGSGDVMRFAFDGTGFTIHGDKSDDGAMHVEVFTDSSRDPASRIQDVYWVPTNVDPEYNVSLINVELGTTPQTYYVQITSTGTSLVLDYIQIEGVHQDLPPELGTNPAAGAAAELDHPLVDGRNRLGTVELTFTDPVQEAGGADMSQFQLPFRVENAAGTQLEPDVQFTYAGLSNGGKTATFTHPALSSRADQAAVRYVLNTTEIPDGFLVSVNGSSLLRAIPKPGEVVFELSESKIASISVVDDPSLPDGTVKKSLQVAFEKPIAADRLDGTQIRYTVNGRPVSYTYAETNAAGLAIYRAEVSPEPAEDSLNFAFQGGIDLREGRYALISADGNYVDGGIANPGGALDFGYTRAQAGQATVHRRIHTESQDVYETIGAQVVFDQPVAVEHLGAGELYLEVDVLLEGGGQSVTEVVRLPFTSISTDRKTLTFESDRAVYEAGRNVTVTLRSSGVQTASGKYVLSAGDKIPVASALPTSVPPVTFNTAAGITGVNLLVDGGFNAADNTPVVHVTFDSPVQASSFAGTWVTVQETVEDAAGNTTTVPRRLVFDRAEQDPPGTTSASAPVAIFRYDNSTEQISFAAGEVAKTFTLPAGSSIQGASGTFELLSYDGNVRIDPLIGVAAAAPVAYTKAQATSATLVRTPGTASGQGNTLTLSVTFDQPLTLNSATGVT